MDHSRVSACFAGRPIFSAGYRGNRHAALQDLVEALAAAGPVAARLPRSDQLHLVLPPCSPDTKCPRVIATPFTSGG